MKTTKILAQQKQKCPCCGEDKSDLYYLNQGVFDKGIISLYIDCIKERFFRNQNMRVNFYYCKTCGTEWESEKYKV